MVFQSFKRAVTAEAQTLGIEDYELYYESCTDTSVDAYRHELNAFSSSEVGGICFRCIVNGKMGYASTQLLNEQEAKEIVRRAADNAAVLETEEQVFLCQGGQHYEPLQVQDYALPTTEELISTVLETQEKLYASDPMVVDGCQTQGISQHSEIDICNSRGLDLHWEKNIAGLMVESVVSDGTDKVNSYDIRLGRLDQLDADSLTKKVTADAKKKLGGEPAPTGKYPVVFAPNAVVSLLAVFSSVFSSENTQKGLSRLGGMEEQTVAAQCVTLVDDPFYQDGPCPRNFDGEGCPTFRKNVIENGVLRTLLYNMKTAAAAGKQTTGNASKSGYDGPVSIRPFTMYLAPGKQTEQQLLAPIKFGIYIDFLGGLHAGASPISGDFSLQSAGFLIENGKKTERIKSFTVAGNFYDLLNHIEAIANNLEFPGATGMTAFGAPSILVTDLSVAGK